MNWLTAFRDFLGPLFLGALIYFALRTWRGIRNRGAAREGDDFQPAIGFTRLDGGAALAVLLSNESSRNIWTEEIEIILTDLIADQQTSDASGHEILKIRQTVQPHDMLPVSLLQTIYKAAGQPQRRYFCVMSAVVRYRAGQEWFEKPLPPHSLEMAGLTLVKNRRERWTKSEFHPESKTREAQTAGGKSK